MFYSLMNWTPLLNLVVEMLEMEVMDDSIFTRLALNYYIQFIIALLLYHW